MPVNIEVKAVVQDWEKAHATAKRLSRTPGQIIKQHDIFFSAPSGRLKLRFLNSDCGELIQYFRPDMATSKSSHYTIARTQDPMNLLQILSASLELLGTVKKIRTLYLIGQTRVHLDIVEGLGRFLEFEVVLKENQPESDGHRVAAELRNQFVIRDEQLLHKAYLDMLLDQSRPSASVSSLPLPASRRSDIAISSVAQV